MKKARLLVKLWLPVVSWCLVVFYLSSIPNLKAASNPFLDEIIRSVVHFVVYTLLYILLFRALNFRKKKKDYYLPLVLSILYGFSDEFHQAFVPTRTFQLKDLIVNFSGAIGGALGIRRLLQKAPEELRSWARKIDVI